MRVSRDIRIIVHKTGGSLMLAYVDHHDDACAWAERRRIEAHPKTGAIQIVEVRERVEEIALPAAPVQAELTFDAPAPAPLAPIFDRLDVSQLLSVGVPEDWVADVGQATAVAIAIVSAGSASSLSPSMRSYRSRIDHRRPA